MLYHGVCSHAVCSEVRHRQSDAQRPKHSESGLTKKRGRGMQNERNNVFSIRRPEYCNRELYMELTVGLHVYMLQLVSHSLMNFRATTRSTEW